jgi:hypothetical protein
MESLNVIKFSGGSNERLSRFSQAIKQRIDGELEIYKKINQYRLGLDERLFALTRAKGQFAS